MGFETPKMPSPEEMAKLEKSRTLSDAELLKNESGFPGEETAEYKFDKQGNKQLEVPEEDIEVARREMNSEIAIKNADSFEELGTALLKDKKFTSELIGPLDQYGIEGVVRQIERLRTIKRNGSSEYFYKDWIPEGGGLRAKVFELMEREFGKDWFTDISWGKKKEK